MKIGYIQQRSSKCEYGQAHKDFDTMVNILKFQTLFSFCSQIKCGFSELEFTKWLGRIANREDRGQSSLVWIFSVCHATSIGNVRTYIVSGTAKIP